MQRQGVGSPLDSLRHFRLAWIVLLVGCQSATPTGPIVREVRVPQHSPAATATPDEGLHRTGPEIVLATDKRQPEGPLSLAQLTEMALANHPSLEAAQARVDAARGQLLQAGLYPNPRIGWEADELFSGGNAAGEQGPVFQQEIVTGGKLALAQAAAAQAVAAADWQAVSQRYELVTRVRRAYFEVLTAQQELEQYREILKVAERGLKAAEAAKEAGKGSQPDIVRAQIEIEKSKIQVQEAELRAEAAWKRLALAVGVPNLPATALEGKINAAAPKFQWDAVERLLERSSELQEFRARQAWAEQQRQLAVAVVVPNVHLKVHPFYSFPEQEGRLLVEAGVALPLFDRNQGNIFAAQAELARALRETRLVELKLAERLVAARRDYENARQRVEAYEKIEPQAKRALELAETTYKAGAVNVDAVLDAQRTLAETQLNLLQSRGALWLAVVEIAGLLQLDELPAGR